MTDAEKLVDEFEVAVGRRAKRGVITAIEVAHNRRAARAALLDALEPQGEMLPVNHAYINGVGHYWVDVCDLVREQMASTGKATLRVTRVREGEAG